MTHDRKQHSGHLESSYRVADTIMCERAVSFYGAFRFLPEARFRSVTALYAFCRHADDLVDTVSGQDAGVYALEKLDIIEKAVRALVAGDEMPAHDYPAWWPAFSETVIEYSVPLGSLLAQLEGQRSDLDFQDLQTLDDLINYGRLVAGSVGTMMVPLLVNEDVDSQNPNFIAACENLGIAMQITNILRDVGEDLRTRDRVYLPSDMLKRYGVSRSELKHLSLMPAGTDITNHIPEGFTKIWEELATTADALYREYLLMLSHFHPDCRLPLVMSQLTYQAIAEEIRRSGYNCLTIRNYTTNEQRLSLLNDAKELVAIYG